jgi:hypothetical protein
MPAIPPDIHDRMEAYIGRGARSVEGWLAPESAQAIACLAETQIELGQTGGVGEIGIHHGKLFLLLYLSMQPNERSFALDVFGNQALNKHASGEGDQDIFLRNLLRVGGDRARVTVFAQDSGSVGAADLVKAVGPMRMMSVDGGHTEDITYNDMALAEAALQPPGILVLDDVYNERWPAVATGAFRFVLEPGHQLRPFAISPNKTYFCKDPAAADHYRARLLARFGDQRLGEETLFGSDVLILGRSTLANRVRNHPAIRGNPKLYRTLSRIIHRFG